MRGDIHIHTRHSSDGESRVEDVIAKVATMGHGVVAITDHNTLDGYREATTLVGGGIILLPGVEVSSSEGHILAYGVTEEVPRDLGVAETIEEIHDRAGIAVAAHPYRWWSGLGEDNVVSNVFDGIEAKNGRSTPGGNLRAERLSERLGLGTTGGSDAHKLIGVGRTFTEFPDDCEDVADLLRAILDGRTRPSGVSRPFSGTVRYGTKAIGEWLSRGMRRM